MHQLSHPKPGFAANESSQWVSEIMLLGQTLLVMPYCHIIVSSPSMVVEVFMSMKSAYAQKSRDDTADVNRN